MAHVLPSSQLGKVNQNRELEFCQMMSVTEKIVKEDCFMSLNQPLEWRNPIGTEVASRLAHVKSELCWCDPIIEVDEYGQKVVMHKEVTWH
jgi:hypothetical protein